MYGERYENGINGSSLIFEYGSGQDGSYLTRMITENRIPGYLECTTACTDGMVRYVYNVTSVVSLYSMYEDREIGYAALVNLLDSLASAMEAAGEYLLPCEHLMTDPAHIFIETGSGRIVWCYYPGHCMGIDEAMNGLAEYILLKADHNDEAATLLAYDLYKQVTKGDFTLRALLSRTETAVLDEIPAGEEGEHLIIEEDELYPPDEEEMPRVPVMGRVITACCIGLLLAVSGFVLSAELGLSKAAQWLMTFNEMKLLICASSAISVLLPVVIALRWFNDTRMYRDRMVSYNNDRSEEIFYFG